MQAIGRIVAVGSIGVVVGLPVNMVKEIGETLLEAQNGHLVSGSLGGGNPGEIAWRSSAIRMEKRSR